MLMMLALAGPLSKKLWQLMLMMLALVRTVVETLPADARLPGRLSKKLSQLMLMTLALAGPLSKKHSAS